MDVAQQIKERHCYTCGDLVKVGSHCGPILGRVSRPDKCECVGAHRWYQQRQHDKILAVCEYSGHRRAWAALLSKTSIHNLAALKARPTPRGCVSAQQAQCVPYKGLSTPKLSHILTEMHHRSASQDGRALRG